MEVKKNPHFCGSYKAAITHTFIPDPTEKSVSSSSLYVDCPHGSFASSLHFSSFSFYLISVYHGLNTLHHLQSNDSRSVSIIFFLSFLAVKLSLVNVNKPVSADEYEGGALCQQTTTDINLCVVTGNAAASG